MVLKTVFSRHSWLALAKVQWKAAEIPAGQRREIAVATWTDRNESQNANYNNNFKKFGFALKDCQVFLSPPDSLLGLTWWEPDWCWFEAEKMDFTHLSCDGANQMPVVLVNNN